MKHLRAISRMQENPRSAQQSALEIKIDFKLNVLDIATGKFPFEPPDEPAA